MGEVDGTGGRVPRNPVQRLPEREREARGGGARGGDGDLLAEHRAHGELGAVDGPGETQPGGGAHERREQRVAGEVLRGRGGVGVEVEQPPAALHGGGEVAQVREAQAALEVAPGGDERDDTVTAG